jgi:hypothetical protein
MTVITKTFREFFNKSFVEDKAYRDFGKKHFEIFYEMANPNHIINKKPVNIDEDDIEFLQQFPIEYWVSAKHARYNMLWKAVKELNIERIEKYNEKEIIEKVKNSIKTGNFSNLEDKKLIKAASQVKDGKNLSDEELEKEAKVITFYYIKDKTPHIKEPGKVRFSLRSSRKGGATIKHFDDKKPFLNRLYHKLETTPGENFHSESGLSGEGKYGFHMGDAQELEGKNKDNLKFARSTAGFKFPNEEKDSSLRRGIIDFLNLNSHQVFGDLPKDFEWKKVEGIEDTWTINSLKNKLEKEGKKIFSGQPNKTERIKEFVNSEIIKKIERGELRGPAIPGINPKGFPVTLKDGKIVNPPLYLPFKNGVPIVNPSHYFRELKDSDIETEDVVGDDGRITKIKKYNPDGSPIYKIPTEKLRGHDKKYVHVGDDEFVKQKDKSSGSFDFNHDSKEVRNITKGSEEYEERICAIFDSQKKISLPNIYGDPVYYEDIIKGILYSINSGWGGISDEQKKFFKRDEEILSSLHMLIYARMLKTQLGNDKLLKKKGRIEFAKTEASTIVQKPVAGFGTRRKKNIGTYSYDQFDSETRGKKVTGLEDIKRKRGERMQNTSIDPLSSAEESFIYDLTNMRATIAKLNSNTKDTISVKDQEVSDKTIQNNIESLLISNIEEKIKTISDVIGLLTSLYEREGVENPEEAANAQMNSWQRDGYNSPKEIIKQFSNHSLVVKAMGNTPQIRPDTNPEEEEEENQRKKQALSVLGQAIDKIFNPETSDEINDALDLKEKMEVKPGERHSDFVKEFAGKFGGDTKLMDALQSEIKRRFNSSEPETLAARTISTTPTPNDSNERLKNILDKNRLGEPQQQPQQQIPLNNDNSAQLTSEKNWIKLAHNIHFLNDRRDAMIEFKKNLLNHLKNANRYDEKERLSAIANIEKSIKGDGQWQIG